MAKKKSVHNSLEERFQEFEKSFPERIVIQAEHSRSSLLPPEDIVLVRDSSTKAVVYQTKMNTKFRPFPKLTNGNGNGAGSNGTK